MDRQKICISNYLIERIGLVEIVSSASGLVLATTVHLPCYQLALILACASTCYSLYLMVK